MRKLLLSIAAGGLMTALSVAPTLAADFTIRIATPTINSVTEHWIDQFKAAVEKRSEGKIEVQGFPGSQLGPIPATVDGVALGTIEISAPASGFFAALDKRFLVFDTPGLFDSFAQAQKVFSDPEVIDYISEFGTSKGIEPLVIYPHSPTLYASHKPINTVADFDGQKMRVPGGGPIYSEPLKALGVSPISMPLGEVVSTMQNRTIDGFVSGSPIFIGFKIYDIVKQLTEVPGGIVFVSAMTNSDFMDSLGDELATIVREEARAAMLDMWDWQTANNAKVMEIWKANGGMVHTLTSEEQTKYNETVTAFLPAYIAANPQFKADYDMLRAAAKRVGM